MPCTNTVFLPPHWKQWLLNVKCVLAFIVCSLWEEIFWGIINSMLSSGHYSAKGTRQQKCPGKCRWVPFKWLRILLGVFQRVGVNSEGLYCCGTRSSLWLMLCFHKIFFFLFLLLPTNFFGKGRTRWTTLKKFAWHSTEHLKVDMSRQTRTFGYPNFEGLSVSLDSIIYHTATALVYYKLYMHACMPQFP